MTGYTTRGNAANIIVGAAALFVRNAGPIASSSDYPAFVAGTSYKDTVSDAADWTNVGYTSNGLELSFEPDFGEVKVDQLLDVAKLFKQGMKVSMKTSFAEATLENLLIAVAANDNDLTDQTESSVIVGKVLELKSGELGDYPIERGIVAVGAGIQDATTLGSDAVSGGVDQTERVYIAYRALSIESVNVSAKRDEATMFEVNFRLLPDSNAAYGKIVDRTY